LFVFLKQHYAHSDILVIWTKSETGIWKISTVLRYGRQVLKAKMWGCKTEVERRGREKRREVPAKKVVIKRRRRLVKGFRVAGVDTPWRFIVGQGQGFWRKMKTRPQAPIVQVWSYSRCEHFSFIAHRPELPGNETVASNYTNLI
jgi:hypothetical protein